MQKNGVTKTIVTHNALEFCNESLVSWLRKNTPIPHSVKWHSSKDGPNCKMDLKAFSPFNQNIEAYIPNLLLSYQTVLHADRKQSPSALMGRQIKAPITMSFATEEKV